MIDPSPSSPSFTLVEENPESQREGLLNYAIPASADPSAATRISASTLTINLVTATLGTGILSLPWATAGASLLLGALITCLVMALNFWTDMILIEAAHRVKVYDLGGLLGRLPGRWNRLARGMCDLTIWVSVFLCLVGYLIVVASSLKLLLPELHRTYRVIIGGFIALPLSYLDQSRLAFSSTLSIAANIYVFGLLLLSPAGRSAEVAQPQATTEGLCIFGMGHGSITMISALMQAAIVQMCVLPMYEQLEHRSPRRFAVCASSGFGSVTVLFVCFSSLGYLHYGAGVSSNILENLPQGLLGDIAKIAMAIAVLGVYPIILSSMIAPIQHSENRAARQARDLMIPSPLPSPGSPGMSPPSSPQPFYTDIASPPGSPRNAESLEDIQNASTSQRCRQMIRSIRLSHVATFCVVCLSMVGATIWDSLGFVNVVNGALQVAALIALVPSAVGYFLLGRRSCLWRGTMIALLISGLVASALGFKYTSNDSEDLLKHYCSWKMMS